MKTSQVKTFHIKTFGCQANEADSEKIANFLGQAGLKSTEIDPADLVVINSCAVRQSAEDRVIGLVHNLSCRRPRPVIIVTGCLLYHPKGYLREKFGNKADYWVKLPDWLKFINTNWPVIVKDQNNFINPDDGPALIPIMEGCDNFCTYCVVPYARGRERSRSPEEIFCLAEEAAGNGKEILLLGQNVNSYGKEFTAEEKQFLAGSQWPTPFPALLELLDGISGLRKISFLTSNPQDFSADLIEALRLTKIDRQLHLPVQSGDDQILKKMNRRYSSLQYIELVGKIRQSVPEIKISTDIIVGFPGETKEQFNNTIKLCRQIGFNKAYINKYSPRPGTAAERFFDNVPWSEKKRRWQILEKLINQS